ncbi:hypothetical protein DSM106972_064860 [Dulcicalothrix desertica PCC 7102]|uniref:Transposase (putative) YhgA-like domain-containing protein n=1 Tax=Dulcicalothrix desertica PCC 7102 TaxID=232991 RepID=A0A3S1D1G2_9CYAN|nr:Rpn family recombination-promoting nuclease/putative transposase [Dulcicalothrix desertica]RUT01863.1 hypothetical protein DSM106972_064860 [Dulcicalothrix desertica PCC 7102]TWH43015.1 putative transposase/invertase (TIGR01784 family) [Dulcicalothrix desertica PCC 7102]
MTADPLFYKIFQNLPELFFELIGEGQDNKTGYEFGAEELKQQSYRLDGLYKTSSGYSFMPLYFVEAQGYKDSDFYNSFFGKIMMYLTQKKPPNKKWYAIVIYDRRCNERTLPPYLEIFLPVLRRFYLDELGKDPNQSLSVGVMCLVAKKQGREKIGKLARQLIIRTNSEITSPALKEKVLQFIQTVVMDKLPNLSVKELEAMLELESLRKSKVYLEGREEGRLEQKIETIPILLKAGFTIEQIAESLKLDVKTVQENVKQ